MEEDIKVVAFDANGVLFKNGILVEEVLGIVKDLKKDLKILLCSNTSRRMFDIWDEKYDFLKYFDDMVLSEDIQVNKPNAEFFKEILRRNLNVLPQNILLVDDNEGNILGAEAEGMTAILFETGDSLRKELEKLGVIL